MAYPNISVANVRQSIPHITSAVVSDSIVEDFITDATNIIEGMFAGQADLTSLRALATTPVLWQIMIKYYARSITLARAYASSRSAATTEDIKYWEEKAIKIAEAIKEGISKVLDSSGNILSLGILYFDIESNKDELDSDHAEPYFGYGDLGEGLKDINDRTKYNPNE